MQNVYLLLFCFKSFFIIMKRIVRKKRPRTGVPPPDEAAASAAKTDSNEFEEQLLLRLPADVAEKVNELISDDSTGRCNLRNKLNISFDQDLRHANVTFENTPLYGRVFDLPTILESLKTFDRSTMYKSCDIGQMIVCRREPWPPIPEDIKTTAKGSFPAHRDDKYTRIFALKHGVTPPLKNVRRRRFRKTLVKKTFDVEDVERELARLFAADSEAAQVRWEVIEEDESASQAQQPQKNEDESDEGDMFSDKQHLPLGTALSARHLFGEDLSSSDESSDDDEHDQILQVPEHFDEGGSRDGHVAQPLPGTPGSNSAFPSSPGGENSRQET